jgi:hypothetical protein
VQLVAYVLDAHYSNAKKVTPPKKPGEGVNCNLGGKEDNDIHILLGKSKGTQPCSSVTPRDNSALPPDRVDRRGAQRSERPPGSTHGAAVFRRQPQALHSGEEGRPAACIALGDPPDLRGGRLLEQDPHRLRPHG